MAKLKTCSFCKCETEKLWFASPPTCMKPNCRRQGGAERKARKGEKVQKAYSSIKQKKREPTGEYKLFLSIYAERQGRCEITGEQIKFDVSNFSHILAKGAYPAYRLNPMNIAHIKPEIHSLYDTTDKETTLRHYPKAIVLYERKERLKQQYYADIPRTPKRTSASGSEDTDV